MGLRLTEGYMISSTRRSFGYGTTSYLYCRVFIATPSLCPSALLLRFRQYIPLLRTRNLQVPAARYKSNIFNILILFLLPLHASLGVLRGGLSSQGIAHAYFGEQVARMSGVSLQFAA